MSSDELQDKALGMNGHSHAAGSPDVTIKFVGSELTIQGHKNALITGSAFFGDHFYQHPSSTKVQAPKCIRPGVNISFDLLRDAIDYLHGNDISEEDVAKHSVKLILAAKAFGIFALEERVKKHLTDKLDRQFGFIASEIQIIELVPALRDLYGTLGGAGDIEIGKQVVGIVTGAAAHACCRKFPVLKKSPEFMGLLKEVPVLAYDMLASDVEVITTAQNGESSVESEENLKIGEGSNEVVTEEVVTEEVVTEEVVTEEVVTEEVVTEVATESVKEVVEETMEEVVEEVAQAVEE